MLGTRSILAVTSELPWPLDTGGHLRTFHLLKALATRFDVRLVTAADSMDGSSHTALGSAGIRLCATPLHRRTLFGEARQMLAAAAAREPYVFYRRHDRPALHAAVAREAADAPPDILYLDHLDSFLFAKHRGAGRVVLDLHNAYATLLARMSKDPEHGVLRRAYLRHEANRMRTTEARAVKAVDLLFTVSEDERRHYAALGPSPIALVPNGVDCRRYTSLPVGREEAPSNILFIGTLSWPPNIEAARFLASSVLPELQASLPDARLIIVGRSPGSSVAHLATLPGVTLAGHVADLEPYLRSAAALAVPLASGGGTRLKILEAFAAGLPVVSTPIGVEGIEARDGHHLLVASRDQFSPAAHSLLADRARGQALAARARSLVTDRYDWSVVGSTAANAIETLLPQG